MAAVGEYPKLTPEKVPYLISLKIKLIHAREFAPHKIGYYEKLIKDWEEKTPKNKLKP